MKGYYTDIQKLQIMNISYRWLKGCIQLEYTAGEVSAFLTQIGLEVGSMEEVETIKGG